MPYHSGLRAPKVQYAAAATGMDGKGKGECVYLQPTSGGLVEMPEIVALEDLVCEFCKVDALLGVHAGFDTAS